jgi:hypothetical protein
MELRNTNRIVGGGLVALFAALLFAALTVFGVINSILGHVMLAGAWLVGCLLLCTELIPGKPNHQKAISCAALGLVVFAMDRGVVRLRPEAIALVSTATTAAPCENHDVQYVPPQGKAVRFESDYPIASELLCPSHGMSEQERLACLCPNRLPYTLRAMAPPKESNFETEITVTKTCTPLYKVRVFLRDVYSALGKELEASPYMPPVSKVVLTGGSMEYDRYSFMLNSTAPQDTIKVSVLTASGLRLVCVNQEN